ncbi:MAG: DEAD/DEAH box helicase, partial [Crocinitomicaceae bacterium]
ILQQKDILIPFDENSKIKTLQEIQYLLVKFGFDTLISEQTSSDIKNFEREQILFQEFSQKAQSIRNDEFSIYPELINEFDQFQKVLKTELQRPLYPLQLLSAFHMAFSQNACNFAVPGAGKTSIVYGAYAYLKSLPKDNPRHVDKLLVIGPLSSFAPWENEYYECFGKKISVKRLSGDIAISKAEKEEHLYSGKPAELTLIFHGSIENLRKPIIDFLQSNHTMVVVDEAHRIKNPEGVWGKNAVSISKEARSRIILTGTPVPNGYEDLYNLFQFIYPYKFKEILKYHYSNLIDMTKNSDPESERVQQFTENISPYFIRIKKDDLKLPPIVEKIVEVDMNLQQREIYDFIETAYIESFKANSSATFKDVVNKAKLIRLRQAASNPFLLAKPLKDSLENNPELGEVDPNSFFTNQDDEYLNDSEFFYKVCNYRSLEIPIKYKRIREIIETDILPKNQKVIIWSIFIQNAKELKEYLFKNEIFSELLIGEVPQEERESIIAKFNDPLNRGFRVLIANPFSVAESISLHKGCHNAIYLERDYNCSNFLQSKDRIHRVGLEKDQTTTYYYIIAKDSIDEIIDRRLQQKIERMEKIINEEIPLFARLNDDDETDIIKSLLIDYAQRT